MAENPNMELVRQLREAMGDDAPVGRGWVGLVSQVERTFAAYRITREALGHAARSHHCDVAVDALDAADALVTPEATDENP